MAIEPVTTLFLLAIAAAGFFLKQLWISAIFLIVLVLYVYAARKPEYAPVPSASGPGEPLIRPIVVKRRYVGPESIYPDYMKIRVTKPGWWSGDPMWEISENLIGRSTGRITRWIRDMM